MAFITADRLSTAATGFYECRKQDLKFQNPLKSWNFIWDFPNICEFFMSQNKMNATFLEFWNFQFFPF